MEALRVSDNAAAAVAVAPRVTLDHVLSKIDSEYYSVHNTVLTICILTTKSGFQVVGTSACASPENFNEKLGRELAKKEAVGKLWGFEDYLLRERLHEENGGTFVTRIIDEYDELTKRLEMLQAFLDRGQPEVVTEKQWALLNDQRDAMRNYHDILFDRLEDIGAATRYNSEDERRALMEAEAAEYGASDPRPVKPELDNAPGFE